MNAKTPRSIQRLEERMGSLEPSTLRYQVLETARDFKSSWIKLGQELFTVHKDKHYRDWGYLTFEAYCTKEIGIRQPTALKLLRSYSFLETEEPAYLKKEYWEDRKPNQIPSYESVNALRLAKQSEKLEPAEYEELKEAVLDEAREAPEVRKKIKYILKSSPAAKSKNPADEKREFVKKFLAQLTAAKADLNRYEFPNKVKGALDELAELLEGYQA